VFKYIKFVIINIIAISFIMYLMLLQAEPKNLFQSIWRVVITLFFLLGLYKFHEQKKEIPGKMKNIVFIVSVFIGYLFIRSI
jgi:hypothetical protein